MTQEKKSMVYEVINHLIESRKLLDDVMFSGEPLSDQGRTLRLFGHGGDACVQSGIYV